MQAEQVSEWHRNKFCFGAGEPTEQEKLRCECFSFVHWTRRRNSIQGCFFLWGTNGRRTWQDHQINSGEFWMARNFVWQKGDRVATKKFLIWRGRCVHGEWTFWTWTDSGRLQPQTPIRHVVTCCWRKFHVSRRLHVQRKSVPLCTTVVDSSGLQIILRDKRCTGSHHGKTQVRICNKIQIANWHECQTVHQHHP